MTEKAKKTIIKVELWLLAIIGLIVFVFGGYIFYLAGSYYRLADNLKIEITSNQTALVSIDETYKISTFNIGFGAYDHDFSFFMDSGEFKDGRKVTGTGSRASSKDVVLKNTNGVIDVIKEQNVDFAFFQEVDTQATRSYGVNQYKMLQESFTGYSSSLAENFHSGYLFYPIFNPHGSVKAGIATLSKYKIESNTRKSLPIDESFPTKFFDLDRCFTVNRLPIQGSEKQLVLINLHLSAYDEGGVFRAKQLNLLKEFVVSEYENGNYIIAGGDWNHDIAESDGAFYTEMKKPDWVANLNQSELPEHFSFTMTKNCATCRSTDIPYTTNADGKMINYSIVIDGFMFSDNIEIVSSNNLDTDFQFSDHNPSIMQFKLKA